MIDQHLSNQIKELVALKRQQKLKESALSFATPHALTNHFPNTFDPEQSTYRPTSIREALSTSRKDDTSEQYRHQNNIRSIIKNGKLANQNIRIKRMDDHYHISSAKHFIKMRNSLNNTPIVKNPVTRDQLIDIKIQKFLNKRNRKQKVLESSDSLFHNPFDKNNENSVSSASNQSIRGHLNEDDVATSQSPMYTSNSKQELKSSIQAIEDTNQQNKGGSVGRNQEQLKKDFYKSSPILKNGQGNKLDLLKQASLKLQRQNNITQKEIKQSPKTSIRNKLTMLLPIRFRKLFNESSKDNGLLSSDQFLKEPQSATNTRKKTLKLIKDSSDQIAQTARNFHHVKTLSFKHDKSRQTPSCITMQKLGDYDFSEQSITKHNTNDSSTQIHPHNDFSQACSQNQPFLKPPKPTHVHNQISTFFKNKVENESKRLQNKLSLKKVISDKQEDLNMEINQAEEWFPSSNSSSSRMNSEERNSDSLSKNNQNENIEFKEVESERVSQSNLDSSSKVQQAQVEESQAALVEQIKKQMQIPIIQIPKIQITTQNTSVMNRRNNNQHLTTNNRAKLAQEYSEWVQQENLKRQDEFYFTQKLYANPKPNEYAYYQMPFLNSRNKGDHHHDNNSAQFRSYDQSPQNARQQRGVQQKQVIIQHSRNHSYSSHQRNQSQQQIVDMVVKLAQQGDPIIDKIIEQMHSSNIL